MKKNCIIWELCWTPQSKHFKKEFWFGLDSRLKDVRICVTNTDHMTGLCSSHWSCWPAAVQAHYSWEWVGWDTGQADTGWSWNHGHIHICCNHWTTGRQAGGRKAHRLAIRWGLRWHTRNTHKHRLSVSGIGSYLFGTPIRSNTIWNCKKKKKHISAYSLFKIA